MTCLVYPTPFGEETAFSPLDRLSCLWKTDCPTVVNFFLGFQFYSIELCGCFLLQYPPYCLDYYSFGIKLKSEIAIPPGFLFCNIALAIQGLLWFYTMFRIDCLAL